MKKFTIVFFVILSVMAGCGKTDNTTPAVTQTNFSITVTDELGNKVSGATVELYQSESDLLASTNIVKTVISDANGIAKFTDLYAIRYWWNASKDCKNNLNGGVTVLNPLTIFVDNKVTTVLTSTGTISIINNSSNPYEIYVNGNDYVRLEGNHNIKLNNVKAGSYSIRVLQLSGYILSPTDKTYTVNVDCGSNPTVSFP